MKSVATKDIMHRIPFWLCPRPGWELTAFSRPPSWISGVLLLKGRRKKPEKRIKRRESRKINGEGRERSRGPQFTFLATPLLR